ncbi:MAG: AraC family ligand binding domain-containing protein [Lachnospiraceae bacterium]|nr:AraC family ligand binding domain-containing protein [Lachnospiraceae bacterium]
MPEKEYVYKSEHCRYLGLTYSKRQNESLYLMCCGIEKCHPGYFFATADRPGYHFHVVLSGQGTLEVEGNASTVRAGQIFVTKPMERTRYQADMETPWTYCWVTFGGEKAIYYLEQAGLRTGVNIRDCRTNPSNFLELISKLMEKPELQLSSDLWRLGILYQFLGLAVKTGTPDKENHNQEYDPDTYVKHGMEYIRHNFASMKIGDVPRSIGIDRSYFTKLFSKKIGVSPREYLILVRMREGAACCQIQIFPSRRLHCGRDMAVCRHSHGFSNRITSARLLITAGRRGKRAPICAIRTENCSRWMSKKTAL